MICHYNLELAFTFGIFASVCARCLGANTNPMFASMRLPKAFCDLTAPMDV